MQAVLRHIEFAVPTGVVTNAELAEHSGTWTADKILEKTGIAVRHVARPDEFASDFAWTAAQSLFETANVRPGDVDYVIYCSQSPDYFLPTTACLLQRRLNLPMTCGAVDVNLGCSGFVYGLGLAKGIIETEQARNVLLLCADTYTKYIRADDFSLRTIFGDAGSACLVQRDESDDGPLLGPFVYGTDGRGQEDLIVRPGGFRGDTERSQPGLTPQLAMDGPAIFGFTLEAVPAAVAELLRRAELKLDDVDLWVFHQANQFMLDFLRKKIGIPESRFPLYLKDYGNTVSCSIPIALKCARRDGRISPESRIALVGFGVGYSWASCIIKWR